MNVKKAREILGLNQTDVCLKEGLESLKECELQQYKRTLDREEKKRIELWVKAIDTLLESGDYHKEERQYEKDYLDCACYNCNSSDTGFDNY